MASGDAAAPHALCVVVWRPRRSQQDSQQQMMKSTTLINIAASKTSCGSTKAEITS